MILEWLSIRACYYQLLLKFGLDEYAINHPLRFDKGPPLYHEPKASRLLVPLPFSDRSGRLLIVQLLWLVHGEDSIDRAYTEDQLDWSKFCGFSLFG